MFVEIPPFADNEALPLIRRIYHDGENVSLLILVVDISSNSPHRRWNWAYATKSRVNDNIQRERERKCRNSCVVTFLNSSNDSGIFLRERIDFARKIRLYNLENVVLLISIIFRLRTTEMNKFFLHIRLYTYDVHEDCIYAIFDNLQ